MKVISRKNVPSYPPLLFTIVMWLLLDRVQAAGWVWGVVGTLVAIIWIGFIINVSKEDQTDIFKKSDS